MRPVALITLTLMLVVCFAPEIALARSIDDENGNISADPSDADPYTDSTTNIIEGYIPWPTYYGVQQTGDIVTSFDCYGLFGNGFSIYTRLPGWPRASFETPPGSGKEYLWGGGIWIGGISNGDTLVSTAVDGWYAEGREFRSPTHPVGSVTKLTYPTDYSMNVQLTDTFYYDDPRSWYIHNPLNVKVSLRSHIWRSESYSDIVIFDMVITNIGDDFIQEMYTGMYFDPDVGHSAVANFHTDDLAGSIREHAIAYGIDNDGDAVGTTWDTLTCVRKAFVLKYLTSSHPVADTNFNWWINSLGTYGSFGPRMKGTPYDPYVDFGVGGTGTPVNDTNKYYILSHPEWDYDQVLTSTIEPDDPIWMYPDQNVVDDIILGRDTRFLLSVGPFDIEPDSSVRILFGLLTGDDVHATPWNFYNLPDNPWGFRATLNFDDVILNGERANELADSLLNPLWPVPGIFATYQDFDSVVIEWDPWILNNVDGYEIYLSEVPSSELPYPGLAAPWMRPDRLVRRAAIPVGSRFTLDDLDPCKIYYLNVAHRTPSGVGDAGAPIFITQRRRVSGPTIDDEYVFIDDQGGAAIGWREQTEIDVDHYNIYRFVDKDSCNARYLPFYSDKVPENILPADSFDIDGTTYYYYAIAPFGTVGSDATSFVDPASADGVYYTVTAVDRCGFESNFSIPVCTMPYFDPARDILVISNLGFVTIDYYDSVKAFYNSILGGYDYDFYSILDTVSKYGCDPARNEECVNWRDFRNFKLAIFDLEGYDTFNTKESEDRLHRLEKYLLTGGRLAYFGSLFGMNSFTYTDAEWTEQNDWFVQRFFAIDSLFFYHYRYYYFNYLPYDVDTSFGFYWAEPTVADLPPLEADTTGLTVIPYVAQFWGAENPPSVSVFHPTDSADVLYRYRSLCPQSSLIEGEAVGVRMKTEYVDSYLFGFHLWQMDRGQARMLIDKLFDGLPTDTNHETITALPDNFRLRQNYPNPFNPSTVLEFDLPTGATVSLEVYNILGQRVKTLIDRRQMPAGFHSAEWHGDNGAGNRVSSGVYFYRLTADNYVASKTMILLK